jgi:Uma2 family endonuclease
MTMQAVERRTRPTKAAKDSGRRVVLYDVDWQAYKTICGAIVDRPVRMTYDRGVLEIMVKSGEHDTYGQLFALIVFALARFYRRKIRCCGSFTHQREDIEKGFEPDQCFYIANQALMKGKKDVDLAKDPPPDLMIEVEVSRSALNRMPIFAAFKVPEVWRFDTRTIRVYVLKNGAYEEVATSPTFPDVPIGELVSFIETAIAEDNVTMVEELEKWLATLGQSKTKPARKGKAK